MNSANIENDCHTRRLTPAVYETLTKGEQKKLARLTKGHGTLTAACIACSCNPWTIKRAAAGMRMLPETAAKIRDYLQIS